MANYAIGDLQGCYKEFQALLLQVDFNPSKDHLYLVGDIVARGPDSLACLDYIYTYQDSITVTLGNHDLHLIANYMLDKPANPKDKLSALLASDKLPAYIDLLKQQPLALWLQQEQVFISHAGLNPAWSIKQALQYAECAQNCYRGPDARDYFKHMYDQHPTTWNEQLTDFEKFRYIVNYFTRMRFLTLDEQLELTFKGGITDSNAMIPWFKHSRFTTFKKHIVFGHWAALGGITNQANIHALDTGCVWGGAMTLLELKNKQLFSTNSVNSI
ncbi:symmetrical bis(5'-nucleosyl)-tetraphosphatase [Pseudoalteromonas arctica]|uniref:bis(5'-nucleosyl)-tetraphosphatase (symmetrical) n=1 Tax=Pseudoalteromonas arctica TaxID=394751 RepID=A0A7Y0DR36_9GAMM|nr:symmetrical bis(5'-nucleosyl)-tetraphosphatase [Pseudoalteromonas arctica]NMM40064.1 symmetrical bis(5'-nucleosyl)-tetraphosphatase [Pseudoalteromonas arctica]